MLICFCGYIAELLPVQEVEPGIAWLPAMHAYDIISYSYPVSYIAFQEWNHRQHSAWSVSLDAHSYVFKYTCLFLNVGDSTLD